MSAVVARGHGILYQWWDKYFVPPFNLYYVVDAFQTASCICRRENLSTSMARTEASSWTILAGQGKWVDLVPKASVVDRRKPQAGSCRPLETLCSAVRKACGAEQERANWVGFPLGCPCQALPFSFSSRVLLTFLFMLLHHWKPPMIHKLDIVSIHYSGRICDCI